MLVHKAVKVTYIYWMLIIALALCAMLYMITFNDCDNYLISKVIILNSLYRWRNWVLKRLTYQKPHKE